jgi:hypothetical protein
VPGAQFHGVTCGFMSEWEYLRLQRAERCSLYPEQDRYTHMLDEFNARHIDNIKEDFTLRQNAWRQYHQRREEIFSDLFNALGREGWELAGISNPDVPDSESGRLAAEFLFKRLPR